MALGDGCDAQSICRYRACRIKPCTQQPDQEDRAERGANDNGKQAMLAPGRLRDGRGILPLSAPDGAELRGRFRRSPQSGNFHLRKTYLPSIQKVYGGDALTSIASIVNVPSGQKSALFLSAFDCHRLALAAQLP